MVTCKFCNKSNNQIKAGYSKSGKQRYKCKNCLRTYTSLQTMVIHVSPPSHKATSSLPQNNIDNDNHGQVFTSLEICAGGGGQALGLEQAGFHHEALVEIDANACATLKLNRPLWNVIQTDLKDFRAKSYLGIDLLSGGVPCPPFSVAGKRLGAKDERNLFDDAIRLIGECQPKAIMLENVRGLLDRNFADYRSKITKEVEAQGYKVFWNLVNAADFGVSQSRSRTVFIALKEKYAKCFSWPTPTFSSQISVGDLLFEQMKSCGWLGADEWKSNANGIAPTLVGGSKKHCGADLGPTRAKQSWAKLGVDAHGIIDTPPAADFIGLPRLTIKMAALIQGFPNNWEFFGKKTPAYRQVGNAFPPPVAKALGIAIVNALNGTEKPLTNNNREKLCPEEMDQKQNYVLTS